MRLQSLLLPFIAIALPASAQTPSGVEGFWSTPAGSVLHVHPCGAETCITVVTIAPTAAGVLDAHNPDRALRSRPVCQLTIGTGFHLTEPGHGEDGRIYDPESGKTYHAAMAVDGTHLSLRGYVGIKALGRTEIWTRTTPSAATCVGTTHR